MLNTIIKGKYIIYILLFLISILPIGAGLFKKEVVPTTNENEMFNPVLLKINTVEKLLQYTDSLHLNKKDTSLYVYEVSEIIKNRFVHGLANYTFSENWIAFLSGKIFWSHLSAIVDPNDILKYEKGLCSQQSIVFMEALRKKGISVRSVALGYKEGPGHFLCEVFYSNKWHLYDVTKEPRWEKMKNIHESLEYHLAHKDSLFSVYEGRIERPVFNKLMEKVEYGSLNQFPAKRMLLFHQVTKVFIYVIPLFFFFLLVSSLFKLKKSKKRSANILNNKISSVENLNYRAAK